MLSTEELQKSEVVANATMNRGRGLSGVNSYEKELRFDIATFLQARMEESESPLWLDICCGEGRALAEAAMQFQDTQWGRKVRIVGVDLVEMFVDETAGVELVAADVSTFQPETSDLITCVHGLHYLGDKLSIIEKLYSHLRPGGLFLGHLDTENLRLPTPWAHLVRQVRTHGVVLDYRRHILRLEQTAASLDFGVSYQGASVSEKPNYTGITVIDSWYARRTR